MAKASAGKLDVLPCSICEEHYNENDRLPKGFPCQHSVCLRCLGEIIALCDRDEVACPLCRQVVPIPQSNAAGFPSNVVILDLLEKIQSPKEQAHSMCTSKVVNALCSKCQEGLCVNCMLKSSKHEGHDVEELSDAMEKCVEQSQEVLHEIIQSCSKIEENISQQTKASSPECLKLLQQLQKYQADLAKTASCGTVPSIPVKAYIPSVRKISIETPVEIASTQEQVGSLLAPNPPRSVNRDILELLASAVLPEFLHIDMNRRNKLLLTYSQGQPAFCKMSNRTFCKMAQPALSGESIKMLEDVQQVVLSHNNKVVIVGETEMMYNNKTYSFHGISYTKVKVFHEDWFISTFHGEAGFSCALFTVNPSEAVAEIIPEHGVTANQLVRV